MDPNTALDNLRRNTTAAEIVGNLLAERIEQENEQGADLGSNELREDLADAQRLAAEAAEALDTWLTKGGFLPTAWQRNTIQPQIVELAGPPLSQFADEVAKVFGLAPAVHTLRFSVATIDGKPSVAWKVNEGMWSRYRPTTVTVDHS